MYTAASLKRKWMTAYLITVSVLYVLLIALYSMFLVSTTETRTILDAIYSILGVIDFIVPIVLAFSWVCLQVMYSGFPRTYVRLLVHRGVPKGFTLWQTSDACARRPGLPQACG